MSFNKNVDIQIDYLGPKEIGERRWNPTQLVDWLLECDVHIILTHLYQGRLSHSLIWCMRDLLKQMGHLHYHLGSFFWVGVISLRHLRLSLLFSSLSGAASWSSCSLKRVISRSAMLLLSRCSSIVLSYRTELASSSRTMSMN